jgi:hypothetical protein
MVSLRDRAVLPGALLAMLVAGAALLALLLALGIRGEGPLTLLLGGADGAARLQDREAVAPAAVSGVPGVQLGPATPSADALTVPLPATAGAAVPAAQRRSAALRGETRTRVPARRSPARAPSRSTPARPAPVARTSPVTATAPRPATAAPAPAVKVRGRGKTTPTSSVPKVRIRSSRPAAPAATPAPAPAGTPVGAPRAAEPVVEMRPYRPENPPVPGAGDDSGVLTRVPPG